MDLAQALFALLSNPNVAYVLLIMGLVSVVIAIATPGSGFVEAGAAVCLVLALIGLSQLPVNIAGIALILLGLVIFIIDLKLQSGLMAIGGAFALGLGSLFLFRPNEQAVAVSWWLIALATLGTAGFFSLGLQRAMHAMRLPAKVGHETLVGEPGVVKTALTEANGLTGTAQVGSELWTVKSEQPLPEGSEVLVDEVQGVMLKVRPR